MNIKQNNFIEKIFENMYREIQSLDSMFTDSQINFPKNMEFGKPYFYGYTMQTGPDGKPIVREFGNIENTSQIQNADSISEHREPLVDVIDDKDGNKIRIVAELPGVNKADIRITENQGTVKIKAENGDRKYNTDVPTGRKLDSPKSKATFTNGMLELEIPIKKSNDETDIRVA
jgi:HSP20 family protein|tara:strand:+ start:84 stop:605 length:522 start_codon:yes stop_codon:yes gene_type:complete